MHSDDERWRLSPEESLAITKGFDRSSEQIKTRLWTLRWIPIAAVFLLGAVFAGDWALARYRLATTRNELRSVVVHRYYRTQLKNGKSEYSSGGSFQQPCIHALFPQMGYPPCWYADRHRDQRIDF